MGKLGVGQIDPDVTVIFQLHHAYRKQSGTYFILYVIIIFASSPERVRVTLRLDDYCGHGMSTYCVFLNFCQKVSMPVCDHV